jgi:hypothetical protein
MVLYKEVSDHHPYGTPHFFAFVINKIIRDIQGSMSWCMLFADVVVSVNKSMDVVVLVNMTGLTRS